jgi:hypothetical protein
LWFLILSIYALVFTASRIGATSPKLRVKKMTANSNSDSNDDLERFQTGAPKYAAYLETPEGRLRLDLAFANLQDFLPPQGLCTCAADQAKGPTGMEFRWFLCTIAYAPAIRSPISGKAEWFSSESFFNSGCE